MERANAISGPWSETGAQEIWLRECFSSSFMPPRCFRLGVWPYGLTRSRRMALPHLCILWVWPGDTRVVDSVPGPARSQCPNNALMVDNPARAHDLPLGFSIGGLSGLRATAESVARPVKGFSRGYGGLGPGSGGGRSMSSTVPGAWPSIPAAYMIEDRQAAPLY